jgi:hypothetical protein
MARTRRTARKSTGRQPTGQIAPRNVPPQQEPQPDSPQEEEPFEIVVTVPSGEDSQEAQLMPQNHDQQEKEDNEKEEEGGNKAEGEEDEDYTPWSNAEKDEIFHDAQQEIQKLRDRLRDSDATIIAYQRMVAGEASDLYASDTCTWSATSSGPRVKNEPAGNNHSPSESRTR